MPHQPYSTARYLKLWLITAVTLCFFAGGYLNNTMTNSIVALTHSWVNEGTVGIEDFVPSLEDVSQNDGRLLSGMPPGLSFLLVPPYFLMKTPYEALPSTLRDRLDHSLAAELKHRTPHPKESENRSSLVFLHLFGILLLSIPLALAMGAAFVKIATQVFPDSSYSPVIYGATVYLMLGSALTDFSATLYHTQVAAALVWLPFCWFFTQATVPFTRRGLFLFGMSLGLAFACDYQAGGYGLVIYLGCLLSTKKSEQKRVFLYSLLGLVVPLLLVLGYHFIAFGGAFKTPYQMRLKSLSPLFGYREKMTAWEFFLHRFPSLASITRIFFDSKVSLFIYNPAMVFGLVASVRAVLESQDKNEKRRWRISSEQILWGICAILLVANFCYLAWLPLTFSPSGGSYGARYTLYSLPFGLLALLPFLKRFHHRCKNRVVLFLLYGCLAAPAWLYLFYGSPNLGLRTYAHHLFYYGPCGYTLYKLLSAGKLSAQWFPWLSWGTFFAYLAIAIAISRSKIKDLKAHSGA